MNRRQALRNIGFGAGIMAIGPATLGLLQSCRNYPDYDWQPLVLSAPSGLVLKKVLDIIIPETDTPGANTVNVPRFIDAYMNEVASPEEKSRFLRSAEAFNQAFEHEIKKSAVNAEAEDIEKVIGKYLKAAPAEKEVYVKRLGETQDPMDKNSDVEPEELFSSEDADALAFAYLKNVRDMGIWAWKTSKEIGENILWHDPVPGEYIPCAPITELGNGKAMSL
ncbi:gluconate 2-dehydrogenase subunit 3 family protein [Christiangramia sabulilitoris]|uniref:Gluconate 2-dehydrogenase subunit 3 family protein n=1 Tax=Christiangramia sabulilitoris TaxID=2583991 RepID=A0A550I851_9FLAO|nr:gluconate 2-dehydrogenase subunit 3 family protein [Christiangramia sabulilitoris]TRO67139.1 gluconate 2-dehydrogenase subunit 3 family protein [Christiangramia sabulilitoris]